MKNPSSVSYKVAALTDVGIKRKGSPNQDSIGSVLPGLFQSRPPLLILADGMGGYAGGSQASQMVIQAFKRVYLGSQQNAAVQTTLEAAVNTALADIRQFSKNKPELESMGSTVVAVVLQPGQASLINVGDSRAYIIRDNQLIQISKDQSMVAEMVRQGVMTASEAQVSPNRNRLNMALSAKRDKVEPHTSSIELLKDDGVLLCSDGLWGCVPETLIQAVASHMPPAEAATRLIELANQAGGADNISVVIAMPVELVKRMKSKHNQADNDKTDPGLMGS